MHIDLRSAPQANPSMLSFLALVRASYGLCGAQHVPQGLVWPSAMTLPNPYTACFVGLLCWGNKCIFLSVCRYQSISVSAWVLSAYLGHVLVQIATILTVGQQG